jgi:hypothetical protein
LSVVGTLVALIDGQIQKILFKVVPVQIH